MNGKNSELEEKYSKWKGIPREEISWNPTIEDTKCVGCGMCVTSCGRDVFGFDTARKKSIVTNPLHCMVGCTSCRIWCIYEAISFPDPTYVRDLIREKKLLILAKKQLAEKLGNAGRED